MKIQTYRGQITPVKNLRNLPINNPKPDLYNINAHTEFGENPLSFTQVIVRKRKYGRTYDRRTDEHTDSERNTIIPRHYRVAGYNKKRVIKKSYSLHCLIDTTYFESDKIFPLKTGIKLEKNPCVIVRYVRLRTF